ncbi:hypothetical protein F2P56_030514 [Juglans regia]|uniref:Uncharacterized protein n=1 Tax=Juglans regia TaxID=51240 RepID=A0A833TZY1_JUGRE|nr:hypothetical protein F2P56_030514 [Juglans regia]
MVTNQRGQITPTIKVAIATQIRTSPPKAKVFLIKIIVALVEILTLLPTVILHNVRFVTNLGIMHLNAGTALIKLFKIMIFLKLLQLLPSTTPTILMVGNKKVKHRSSTSPTPFANLKSSSNSSVHYQLCDKEGHLAKRCWNFLKLKKKQSANLAEAFSACSIQDFNDADWFPDSGATSHMTSDTEGVDQPAAYSGNERVMVGNGSGHKSGTGSRKM